MCSRYELNATAREVAARFGLTVPPPLPNRAEVRPTDLALVVGPGREGRLARWGLEVPWDKRPLINARAETLGRRAAFRGLLANRVLIPASLWFEWRKEEGGGKSRFALRPAAGSPFAFAGLADGGRFTMVTCAPSPSIAHIHDRMPVVLAGDAESLWLDPAAPFEAASRALRPYEGEIASEGGGPSQGDLFA